MKLITFPIILCLAIIMAASALIWPMAALLLIISIESTWLAIMGIAVGGFIGLCHLSFAICFIPEMFLYWWES